MQVFFWQRNVEINMRKTTVWLWLLRFHKISSSSASMLQWLFSFTAFIFFVFFELLNRSIRHFFQAFRYRSCIRPVLTYVNMLSKFSECFYFIEESSVMCHRFIFECTYQAQTWPRAIGLRIECVCVCVGRRQIRWQRTYTAIGSAIANIIFLFMYRKLKTRE